MPDISVVISAYNAEATLAACLRAFELARSDRSAFEVILVDDGSTDRTADICRKFAAAGAFELRYILNDRKNGFGPGFARNLGLKQARGRIIACTDADCVVDEGWLAAIDDAVRRRGLALVGGETWCDEPVIFPWKMSPAGQRGITANLAFDREKAGETFFDTGFRGYYGEDSDFICRLEGRGLELHHEPAMRVFHPVRRMTLAQVARRVIWRKNEVKLFKLYGRRAAAGMHQFFRPLIGGRVSPATLAFLAGLAVIVAAALRPAWLPVLAVLIVVLAVVFLLGPYRLCVVYAPPGPVSVPLADRLRTLVNVVIYIPCFVCARVAGSLENRFLML